jgi:predicted DsbA family dithiol-disulfide isomerase
MSETLIIDIVSDVVCPWCYVGKMHLEAALSDFRNTTVALHWRPFQLDPTIPPKGLDRKVYMERKFGDLNRLKETHQRLENLGKACGISFNFEGISKSPNTLDSHRLIHWAQKEGKGDGIVRALFEAYFENGYDIGDHDVLTKIASSGGLNPTVIAKRLSTDEDKASVQNEIMQAQRMGVTGVPFFIIARKIAVSGAQPQEILSDAIRQAMA